MNHHGSSSPKNGFYVASRASIPERAAMWRAHREAGVTINSSWIDEDGEGQTGCFAELWTRIVREIKASEALVLYVEESDFPLKGAYVEAGIAVGLGIPVRLVMPNVVLEGRSCRPIGSWINHPLVKICVSTEAALCSEVSSLESVPS